MRGTLRKRRIANGKKESLYIDYFPKVWNPIKKVYTRREFLKIHLFVAPKNALEAEINRVHQEIADKILVKRLKALLLDANGLFNNDALESDFYEFAKIFIRKKSKENVHTDHYEISLKYLNKFAGEHVKFRHIDEIFIQRFKDFLLTTGSLKNGEKLQQNSAASYFDKFIILVEEAYLQRYLPEDYTVRVPRISNVDTHFDLLDDDELQRVIDSPCPNELVYKSSMFALLTGLRFSAVRILRWENFRRDSSLDVWYIDFIDPKPERQFRHYISQQVMDLIGDPPENLDELVFPKLNYSTVRLHLMTWFQSLGFGDKAKFHHWRRLYITRLIEAGEDIYLVSKMANHKHVNTTERYAQMRSKSRAKAAKKVFVNANFKADGRHKKIEVRFPRPKPTHCTALPLPDSIMPLTSAAAQYAKHASATNLLVSEVNRTETK